MRELKSINPFSGEVIAKRIELSDMQVQKIVKRSWEAFKTYREPDFSSRKECLFKAADILKSRAENFAAIIVSEMGKLKKEAEAEVKKCAWVCEYYAENAEEMLQPLAITSDASKSQVIYQPLGPVLAVMPWNFPFWQVFRFAAPGLMAGNTALLKHASNVQGCAEAIENIFKEAGFPVGVFQNLTISSSKVESVIAAKEIKAITLTGSESAGSAVASLAGKYLKKTVLELGGNNAFVVLKDADLDLALSTAMTARLQNAGQSCIAAKRFIVEAGIRAEFEIGLMEMIRRLVAGDPMDINTTIAPLFAEVQAMEVERQVQNSIQQGARLIIGGKRDKTFFEPTILTGVVPGMDVFEQETFGPVFAITEAESAGHALELSNASRFGLGMQVFTSSESEAERFIHGADEGAVFVNGMVKSDPRLPFGGVKRSGYGRELSREGILEFTNAKTTWVK